MSTLRKALSIELLRKSSTGWIVVYAYCNRTNFHDGLQSMEARFCVDLATIAIKMSALAYPTKSNALASYCTENEGTPWWRLIAASLLRKSMSKALTA